MELGVEPKTLTPEAAAALSNFDWPGNVRQLVNACRRLTVTAPGREIKVEDIPADLGGVPGPAKLQDEWTRQLTSWAEKRLAAGETPLLDDAMPEFERTLIRAALRKARRRPSGSGAPARLGSQHAHAQAQRACDGRVRSSAQAETLVEAEARPASCFAAASDAPTTCRSARVTDVQAVLARRYSAMPALIFLHTSGS